MATTTSEPEQENEKESTAADKGVTDGEPEKADRVGTTATDEESKDSRPEPSERPAVQEAEAEEGHNGGNEGDNSDDVAPEIDLAVLGAMAAQPDTAPEPGEADQSISQDAYGAEDDEDFAVAVADAYGLIEEAGDDADLQGIDEPGEQYDAEAAAKWAEEDALANSAQDPEEEGPKRTVTKGQKESEAPKPAGSAMRNQKDGGDGKAPNGTKKEGTMSGPTSPLELDVQYYALGRKLDTAPERLTLNLSKEGAKSALLVADGHLAYLPDLTEGKKVLFQVLSVKPWSAYLELQTCNGKEHGLALQDLKSGGRVRVRVGGSLLEEVALQAIRVPRLPKAGLSLSSFMSCMKELGGSAMDKYCQSPRPPRWLEISAHFVCRYSDARSEHLIRPIKEAETRTPLECTVRVLLAPMTRKGVPQSYREEALPKLLQRLQAVLPAPASLPPLVDVVAFRRWVEKSPAFEIQNKDIGDGQEEVVCIKASEKDTINNPGELKETKPSPKPEKPKEVQRPAEEPEGGKQPRCRRAVKALDAVRKMHADALRLSRNKGRVAQLCTDESARGSKPYENSLGPLLQVISGLPEAVQRLHDELAETAKAGSELSELGTWKLTLEEHKKRAEEIKELLCNQTTAGIEEIEENLLRARHRFRDLQQQVLDPGLAVLTGGSISKGHSPPRERSPPSTGKNAKGKGKDKGERRRDGKGKDGEKGFANEKVSGKGRGSRADSRDTSRRGQGGWWSRSHWDYDDWEDQDVRGSGGSRWSGRTPGSRSRSPGHGRKVASTSKFRGDSLHRLQALDIEIGKENLYEVKSSEGPWYPATILRERRSGRFEACLYGGGCAVHYPSVELSEIRRIEHGGKRHSERGERHSVRPQGSLSRDRVIRYDSRTRKGNKADRSWKDAGRDRHAW